MIVTLTPNPSVDRTLTIPEIRFNTVLRSQSLRLDWGGKGFNVSRCLMAMGVETVAMAWLGGGSGKMIADGLEKLGIKTEIIWVEEETRTSTQILEESGSWYVKVNEPGPVISAEAIAQLMQQVDEYARKGDIWVLSGSLPPDVPLDFYAALIVRLKNRGVKVFLDSSDEALKHGVESAPFLLKINADEVGDLISSKIEDQSDAKRAVLPFLRRGIQYVALTLGDMGMLLASQKEMVMASPPEVTVRNVTGAGDATMAGLIYALQNNLPIVDVARWAVAAGTTSVMFTGVSEMPMSSVKEIYEKVESKIVNVM